MEAQEHNYDDAIYILRSSLMSLSSGKYNQELYKVKSGIEKLFSDVEKAVKNSQSRSVKYHNELMKRVDAGEIYMSSAKRDYESYCKRVMNSMSVDLDEVVSGLDSIEKKYCSE